MTLECCLSDTGECADWCHCTICQPRYLDEPLVVIPLVLGIVALFTALGVLL